VALITWLGLYPTVLLVSLLLGGLTESWPLALRLLVVTALVVPLMVYVVTPALTRLLAGWLRC
jgi:antibiotic biosynthesis monooxygenase (ABM) superfamily enzyme